MAFYGCKALSRVVFHGSPQVLCDALFRGCPNLKEVVVPDSVRVIGRHVFDGCVSLERVVLPSALKEIRACAFFGCAALADVSLPEWISVAEDAFDGCPVKIDVPVRYYDGSGLEIIEADICSGGLDGF
jgi:hypothetical protein